MASTLPTEGGAELLGITYQRCWQALTTHRLVTLLGAVGHTLSVGEHHTPVDVTRVCDMRRAGLRDCTQLCFSSVMAHSIASIASKASQVASIEFGLSDAAAALIGMSIVRHAALDRGAQQVSPVMLLVHCCQCARQQI